MLHCKKFMGTLVLLASISCGRQNATKKHVQETAPQDVSAEVLQNELFDRYCVSCHGTQRGAAGIDLTDFAGLVNQLVPEHHGHHEEEQERKNYLLRPGKPKESAIYIQIANGSMPPRETVPEVFKKDLEKYIQEMKASQSEGEANELEPEHKPMEPSEEESHEEHPEEHTEPEPSPQTTPSAASQPKPNPNPNPSEEPFKLEPTTASVQAWVNQACLKCHDTATERNRFTDLSDVHNVIAATWDAKDVGPERKLILPGYPYLRYFYVSLDPNFTPEEKLMPLNSPSLREEELAVIKEWIESMPKLEPRSAESAACALDPFTAGCPCFVNPDAMECETGIGIGL